MQSLGGRQQYWQVQWEWCAYVHVVTTPAHTRIAWHRCTDTIWNLILLLAGDKEYLTLEVPRYP